MQNFFQIWRLIRGMEVMKNYKIAAQYIFNYACLAKNTWGVNTNVGIKTLKKAKTTATYKVKIET